jgi:translation elongation factor EF-4
VPILHCHTGDIGYASFDDEFVGYGAADLVKLDILINGDPDTLCDGAALVHPHEPSSTTVRGADHYAPR